MNAEQLLKHYERVAEAPDAVMRLRGFVLDIAVRGKLVPQSDNEESAEALLQRIASEKVRRVKAGEVRQPKELPLADEPPCTLPQSWRWSCLAEIGFISPRAEADDDTQASFVPMPMIAAELGVAHQHEPRKWGEIKKGYTHFAEGDVGLAKITPCFENGKSTVFRNLTGGIGSGTTELHVVRPVLVSPDYVLLFFKSSHFIETGIPRMTGTAGQKRVPADYFAYSPFPLPPLAEQHRIVAKVDELMALCDRLEAARAQRDATRDRLTASTLARLNAPEPPASPDGNASKESAFQSDARFALKVLPALTTRPDQIKQLRRAVLNLAVRGKLVEQNRKDGEVNLALMERESKAHSRTRRGVPATTPVPESVKAWGLPQSWSVRSAADLLRCGALVDLKDGNHGANHPKVSDFSGAGIPFITAAQVRDHQLDFEGAYKLSGAPLKRLRIGFAMRGDVIYTHKGTVGRVAVAQGDCVLSPQTTYYRPDETVVTCRYLMWFLESDLFSDQVDEVKKQTTRDFVAISKQYEFFHAIPPLREQRRIVTKVDELMALCDQLESSLIRGENTRSRLLNSLLYEVLQPTHENVIDIEAARQRLLEKRQAVACRIVERLSRTKGFGRVRAVKPLYFAEAHCGVALGGRWGRGDFGPYDHWIRSFESQAVTAGWLTFVERQAPDGSTRVEYTPGPQLSSKAQAAIQVLGDGAAEFERVLTLLAGLDTSDSEIVATLYAAWNDLLLEKKPTSDDLVISEFREHWGAARKADFDPPRLQKWLDWMRKNQLTPKGRGPITRHQAELI